jgi:hypothetical protein
MEEDPSSVADNFKLSSDYTENEAIERYISFLTKMHPYGEALDTIYVPMRPSDGVSRPPHPLRARQPALVYEFPRLDVIDSVDGALHFKSIKREWGRTIFHLLIDTLNERLSSLRTRIVLLTATDFNYETRAQIAVVGLHFRLTVDWLRPQIHIGSEYHTEPTDSGGIILLVRRTKHKNGSGIDIQFLVVAFCLKGRVDFGLDS